MSHKITGPSNFYVRTLIRDLKKTKKRIWRTLSKKLSGPRQNRLEANLYRINKKTKKDDVIVVPGKVLGIGDLDHKITIACLSASKSARAKIEASGSKFMTIEELLQENPKGNNVKIFY
ncbi:MAG: 50S ribosomal protein L18e [Candidatus Lokiarchaeota archaeon]|nr:50S ribosomal protein L18e [Candidatus Lokiarchaeota archaeon]MBD3341306.1 50S ribosomal protein L18e [Candidatus Lokiarchaeota archaeon]